MNTRILTLKADLAADLQAIAALYRAIERYGAFPTGEEQLIVVAYHFLRKAPAFKPGDIRSADRSLNG